MTERLSDAAGRMLREQVEGEDDRPSMAERARFVEAAVGLTRAGEHRAGGRMVLLIAALSMILGVVAVILIRDRDDPLRFSVGHERREGNVADYITAPRSDEVPLYFSDGTAITLEPSARARVQYTTSHGATVLVEDGALDANVVHRGDSEWTFTAGPYLVHVTGTSFVMSWSPSAGLDLQMRAGAVRISGPGIEAGLTVKDREHFASRDHDRGVPAGTPEPPVDPASRVAAAAPPQTAPETETYAERVAEVAVRSTHAARRSGSAAVPAGTTPPVPPADDAPPGAPPSETSPGPGPAPTEQVASPESWSTLVARGQYGRVLEAAEGRGNGTVLQMSPESDVEALADAARFSGRRELAEQSLKALRTRFPGTAPAIGATFLLGRMADDAASPSAAVKWYATYLSEAPAGAFAAEALGRRMLALRRLNDPESTRVAARDYLARFPNGPYARIAREIAAP